MSGSSQFIVRLEFVLSDIMGGDMPRASSSSLSGYKRNVGGVLTCVKLGFLTERFWYNKEI